MLDTSTLSAAPAWVQSWFADHPRQGLAVVPDAVTSWESVDDLPVCITRRGCRWQHYGECRARCLKCGDEDITDFDPDDYPIR